MDPFYSEELEVVNKKVKVSLASLLLLLVIALSRELVKTQRISAGQVVQGQMEF